MNQRRNFLKLASVTGAVALLSGRFAMASTESVDRCAYPGLRTVALAVDTTGIDPVKGHRIIEISAIEIVDWAITGRSFHTYCDPERAFSPAALAVTGLNRQFLTGKPKFGEIINTLMLFIGDASLISHNAPFSLAFLDAELQRLAGC